MNDQHLTLWEKNVAAVQRGRKPPKQKPKQAVKAGHDFSEEFNSDSECSSIDDAEVEVCSNHTYETTLIKYLCNLG